MIALDKSMLTTLHREVAKCRDTIINEAIADVVLAREITRGIDYLGGTA